MGNYVNGTFCMDHGNMYATWEFFERGISKHELLYTFHEPSNPQVVTSQDKMYISW
jgi:hypothetical protein